MLAASQSGNVRLVTSLLNAGTDVNMMDTEGETPLSAAASSGELDTMTLLLTHGADVDLAGGLLQWTALHRAVAAGQDESVECLLKHGATPDIRDAVFRTPLLLAVIFRHVQSATVLLAGGADPNLGNKRFGSPLNLAASQGNDCMVENLLMYGACLDFAPYALHNAIEVRSLESLRVLLISGADPDLRDLNGKTPLVLALLKSRPDMVLCLLQHNCDTELRSHINMDIRINRTVTYAPLYLSVATLLCVPTALLLIAGADTSTITACLDDKLSVTSGINRTKSSAELVAWVKAYMLKPRSLKHICRTVIRKNMPSVKFYQLLSHLPLPQLLKDYIGLFHLESQNDESDYAKILLM